MLVFARRIENFNVNATDGELGKVKDVYFDDDQWVVRYLVVDTQKWLPGRKVLVSPVSFDNVDLDSASVNIFETKEQIKDSPHIDVHQPVSRRQEKQLHAHYGWPAYWTGANENFQVWGPYGTPFELMDSGQTVPIEPEVEPEVIEPNEKLRSFNEVKGDFNGYRIQARDGEVGHVTDFIIDDENWKIRYFVVETRNWLPGNFVVLSTDWIEDINWREQRVVVNLPKEKVKNGPYFDPDDPFTREDERKLYESYNKTPYF